MEMSKSRSRWLLALSVICFVSTAALAQGQLGVDDAIYVDFGSSANATSGNWNNMTSTYGTIENAITDSGAVTNIGFALPDRFNGVNENGTQAPDPALGFPVEATRDSFYANDVEYSGLTEPTAQLVISGLDPTASYELTLFCSRMDVGDVRQTQYAISGDGGLQETLYLDPANNVDTAVYSQPIRPTASGEIIIDIQKGPQNNNGYGFYYLGTLVLRMAEILTASQPTPPAGAMDVPTDVTLGWMPGQSAVAHNVYFGTDLDAVTNADLDNPLGVLLSQGQTETTCDLETALELGQTYYWRVDEVSAAPDNTIFKGSVWSFTAEPLTYPIAGIVATTNGIPQTDGDPANIVNGSGLNENDEHSIDAPDMWLAGPAGDEPLYLTFEFDGLYKLHEMWVWNYNVQFEPVAGFGLKDVTVEYSTDGADWTVLGDVELAQATAVATYTANTTVGFAGAVARYVRLTVNSGHGMLGQFGLSEVRFLYIPVLPRGPQPADGATDVNPNTLLTWRAGREAVSHDVSLGTDPDDLALVDTIGPRSYDPGALDLGTTYYWKVDEVNDAAVPAVWEGDIWSFSTLQYVVIDDMESYDDEDNAIFDTWLDGFVNETGSTVGYFDAPFAEQTIVNSGAQSMPLKYDNSAAPFYSEAELDLGSMNLTGNGADTLRLFVSGLAPDFFEAADGTILMNGIGADIWDAADQFRYAYKRLTGDGSMVARVEELDGTPSTWAKAGVMVRQNDAVGSTHSFMCMTGGDGNGASWQGRPTENGTSVNNDATSAVAPPYWVRIDRAGDTLTGYLSPDGQDWTQLGDARSISMTDPVLIGLALTSHNAAVTTSATFSNVSFTGNVAATWEMAEIGVAQPEGNIPESIYVALEDANGNVAVVTSQPGATARSGWNEWLIPYTDLAGVNLSRVATMVIGIGDRDNPTAGGAGTIFIDDVGYGHPAVE